MTKPKWKEIRPGLWSRPIDPEIQKLMPASKPPNKWLHLTAFGARLAWLFFGFILLLAMVLFIIGGQ